MSYTIYPMNLGDIEIDYSFLVWGTNQGTKTWVPTTSYLILGADKPIFVDASFRNVDELSASFGAWLQHKGLAPGARVALMMPNLPQYMVAIAAVLRAGYTVVNVNPLYTPRELEHQLNDSGAEAIVMTASFELFREFEQFRLVIFGFAMVGIMIWRPRGFIATRTPSIFLKQRKAVAGDLVGQGHG